MADVLAYPLGRVKSLCVTHDADNASALFRRAATELEDITNADIVAVGFHSEGGEDGAVLSQSLVITFES